MPSMMLMYGAPPPPRHKRQHPSQWPISIVPADPSDTEIADAVRDALTKKPGKVDPPPAEADRELAAITAVLTKWAELQSTIRSVAGQLTPEERARVSRYLHDRIGVTG